MTITGIRGTIMRPLRQSEKAWGNEDQGRIQTSSGGNHGVSGGGCAKSRSRWSVWPLPEEWGRRRGRRWSQVVSLRLRWKRSKL